MKSLILLFFSFTLALANNNAVDKFTTGNRVFTGEVYNQLLLDSKENILVSPFSASTIFALTQSGAVGTTGEEIRRTLHLPESREEIEDAVKSVLPTFESDSIALVSANKIFVEDGLLIKEGFQDVAREVYQAQFENIDFQKNEEAAEEINKWVQEETKDKIKDLVSPDDFDATTKLVLVNALYFQANWTVPFDPYYTKKAKFFTSETSTIDSITMYKESEIFKYYESEELDAQVLEIPFKGGDASMTIVLPKKKEGIAVLEKQIGHVLEMSRFTEEFVEVQLPKFKIESTIDFKDILEKMGIHSAFDFSQADFSEIAGQKGDLFIGKAKQKTYIDVNEIGVEAAAATEIGGNDSAPPPSSKSFIADHPFVFYIKVHDIILFEGRVLVPEYDE